jgi:Spherulation-specific family 4
MFVRSAATRRVIAATVVFAAAGLGAVASAPTSPAQPAAPKVGLAVPAYFQDQVLWDRVLATAEVTHVIGHPTYPAAPAAFSVSEEKELADRLAQAKAKGKKTLVYVTAGYDKVTWQAVADRVDQVIALYPNVDGVFLDEILFNECDKYTNLVRGVGATKGLRARHPGKEVVLNPGAPILNCYEGLADGYLTMERAYKDVQGWIDNVNLPGNVPFYSWMFKAERRPQIWQIVHSVPDGQLSKAIDETLTRNVSILYVTQDVLPNAFDTLPADDQWRQITQRVAEYNSGRVALPSVVGLKTPATTRATPTTRPRTTKTTVRRTTKTTKKR